MSEGKFCSDCEHSWGGYRYRFCHRPTSKINLVSGKPFVVGGECRDERASIWWPWSTRCGPEGRHWKPKAATEKPGQPA